MWAITKVSRINAMSQVIQHMDSGMMVVETCMFIMM